MQEIKTVVYGRVIGRRGRYVLVKSFVGNNSVVDMYNERYYKIIEQ